MAELSRLVAGSALAALAEQEYLDAEAERIAREAAEERRRREEARLARERAAGAAIASREESDSRLIRIGLYASPAVWFVVLFMGASFTDDLGLWFGLPIVLGFTCIAIPAAITLRAPWVRGTPWASIGIVAGSLLVMLLVYSWLIA